MRKKSRVTTEILDAPVTPQVFKFRIKIVV